MSRDDRESFEHSIACFVNIWKGMRSDSNLLEDRDVQAYMEGYTFACFLFSTTALEGEKEYSGDKYTEGFRSVVEFKTEREKPDGWSDESVRGYEDALRMLRSAKGLS